MYCEFDEAKKGDNMNIIKRSLIIIFCIFLIFSLFLFYISFTDYKPDEVETLAINNNQVKTITLNEPLTVTTYNIGYAGLDEEQNFFADGGKNSRAKNNEKVLENLDSIVNIIDEINPDILLMQEVDVNSSRSYKIDQKEYLSDKYPNYSYVYGKNYDVPWVPVPIFKPMGKAESGIITCSKFHTKNSYRFDLPGKEKWPVQLFELDRCFTETRYQVENDKDLVVINLHLSAFDEGGFIRQQQLAYLINHLNEEYKRGSYIVVGGDWNHNLPDSDPHQYPHVEAWPFWLKNLPDDFHVDGFNWAIDDVIPTVRTLEREYKKGYNFLASIDGFLVSDNIEIVYTYATDTNFKNTDHNPVTVELILK